MHTVVEIYVVQVSFVWLVLVHQWDGLFAWQLHRLATNDVYTREILCFGHTFYYAVYIKPK